MNRCPSLNLFSQRRRWLSASLQALLLASASWALPAAAQGLPAEGLRNFPPDARFGELVVGTMPDVTIDGKAIRTTPGFRLFSPERTLIMAHNFQGKKLVVAYAIEPSTQWLHAAWILTPAEAAHLRAQAKQPR